jgi:hypothetical protein
MGGIEDREEVEVEERASFTVVSHRGLLYRSAGQRSGRSRRPAAILLCQHREH